MKRTTAFTLLQSVVLTFPCLKTGKVGWQMEKWFVNLLIRVSCQVLQYYGSALCVNYLHQIHVLKFLIPSYFTETQDFCTSKDISETGKGMSWACWHTLLSLALGRQTQVDYFEVVDHPGLYNEFQNRTTQQNSCLQKKKFFFSLQKKNNPSRRFLRGMKLSLKFFSVRSFTVTNSYKVVKETPNSKHLFTNSTLVLSRII